MAVSVPIVSLIAFCSLAFTIQGLIIGAGAGDDAAFPTADFTGGFFSDVGALLGWFADFFVFMVRFVTFDLVPAIPAFIQIPLALICGTGVLIVIVWLATQAVQAIGSLIPFT